MMRPRLKIEQCLFTYEHESFFKVELSCQHTYYKDGKCTDIVLELTTASKAMLKAHAIFFKENGHSILIGRKKTNSGKDNAFNSILPPEFPEVVIQVKVINSRFWLVTDFDVFSKSYNPPKAKTPLVFRNKDEGLSFAGAYATILKALAKEHFKEAPKYKDDLPVLSKDIFAVVVLDLNQIREKAQGLSLLLQAPAVKLRYKVAASKTNGRRRFYAKKPNITDVLSDGKALEEASGTQDSPIRLQVKHSKKEDPYVLESADLWEMRQENEHQTANFFKFEAGLDANKVIGGEAEVFLPFPSRIHSKLLKREGKIKVIEQEVKLLRFAVKTSS